MDIARHAGRPVYDVEKRASRMVLSDIPNVLAMTGVEVGRTNYGMIRLTKDREAKTSLKCFQEMSNEYKRLSKDDIDVVRVHHDKDKSFEGASDK